MPGSPAPSRTSRLVMAALAVAVVAAFAPAHAGVVVREKDANLDIARRVRDRLRAAGVAVTMTRSSDRTLSPSDRYGPANRLGVDAFVSLHNNASSSRSARGSEVYRSIRRDGSARLGRFIVDGLERHVGNVRPRGLRTRRGCCGDYYYQLRLTRMPAVIVESAFVSNPTEGRKLATSARFRQAIADAVAEGILRYQRSLIRRRAPRLDPGVAVPAPLPPPTTGNARALGGTRVALAWKAAPGVTLYRVYRDGRLIAQRKTRPRDLLDTPSLRLRDVWAAPGQTYRYEIKAVRELRDGVFGESLPLTLTARTPAISVVVDAGHGGRDPGAVARY